MPDPFSIKNDGVTLTAYGYLLMNGFRSHHEFAMSILVSYEDRLLSYAPYPLLDADTPMAADWAVWVILKKVSDVNGELRPAVGDLGELALFYSPESVATRISSSKTGMIKRRYRLVTRLQSRVPRLG